MKKLLFLALAAIAAMPAAAQDEIGDDVTKYIMNPGFDDDISFTAAAEPAKTTTVYNTTSASRFLVAADGSIYTRNNEGHNSYNGFVTTVKGWTTVFLAGKSGEVEISPENAQRQTPEWVYFGSMPYSLPHGVFNTGRPSNGSFTTIDVPEKPAELSGADNTGVLQLRAGWTNSCVYKQVVTLPCARYRLDYWVLNSGSIRDDAKNLCRVTCRGEVFVDDEGFNSTEWVKHSIEFTPTAEFSIEFGFEAANDVSSNQPVIWIDGITLTKVDDADEAEILQSDCWQLLNEFLVLEGELSDYDGLIREMDDLRFDLEDRTESTDVAELTQLLADIQAAIDKYTKAKADVVRLEELVTRAENLAYDTDYPGKDALERAIEENMDVITTGGADAIAAAAEALEKAIMDYYLSQDASEDSPADFTFAVKNPWFVAETGEPRASGDGYYTFPNQADYTVGQQPADGTSEGWYIGEAGGDQRLNWVCDRTCWNAWRTSFQTISISQDLTGLPNGFYKVAADFVTQDDCYTTQHVYAKSVVGTTESPVLDDCNWDGARWQTLTTGQSVLVADGTLTIGAASTGDSENLPAGYSDYRKGWFCVTNFRLLYCGPATDEQIAEALAARVEELQGEISAMHFAADKSKAGQLLAEYGETKDYAKLTEAAALAETSEAKYNEILEEGKTIPTVRAALEQNAYGDADPIARFALEYVENYIGSDTATYERIDAKLDEVKNYVNTYVPVYQEAAALRDATQSATVRSILADKLDSHRKALTSEMQNAATVGEYVEELRTLIYNVNKQEAYDKNPDATDYTSFIQNPMAEAETGWAIDKGTGNTATNGGQWYTGDTSVRYFDSWNGTAGTLDYYGYQVVEGVPNGTYTIGVDVRTSGEGAFVFGANGGAEKADTTWLEIPLQTYTHVDEATGETVTDDAWDQYGAIWEEAVERFKNMRDSDPDYYYLQGIVNAHGGLGYGWMHLDIAGVEVKDHRIVIGMTTDGARSGKDFTGTWFSVGNWQLTLTAKGDNTGWSGPLATGIAEIAGERTAADGIYSISGMRTGKLQRGLNIIVRDGKATKVIVK